MRPEPGQVLHFSEDPMISDFEPHVAWTATDETAYVWAVDARRAPDYWFPRQCPRALAWVTKRTTEADRQLVLGPTAARVHVIEYAWFERVERARLFAYSFDAADFEPYGDPEDPHAMVSRVPVSALGRHDLSAIWSSCTSKRASSCALLTGFGLGGTSWSPPASVTAVSVSLTRHRKPTVVREPIK